MRYDPRNYIDHPNREYANLWRALYNLVGVRHEKIYWVRPDWGDRRYNWYIPAKVYFNENDDRWFAILWKEIIYFKPSSPGATTRTKNVRKRLVEYLKENNIPILFISKRMTEWEMEHAIQKWMIRYGSR